MKKRIDSTDTFVYGPGTPFYGFSDDRGTGPELRVMPSHFRYPVLPAACTFIRNINTD